jgi:multiple sugar transport system permease protein
MIKMSVRHSIWTLFLYAILLATCFTMLAPFLWMITTSLKTQQEVYEYPPKFLPKDFIYQNYITALTAVPFFRFLFNSVFVAVIVTFIQLICCAMGAYAFARLKFRGKNKIFVGYIATMMIPFQITLTPLFVVFSKLNMIDTYFALIIPGIFSAYGTFLFRQFFISVPKDLEDSVKIDGGGYWLCFTKIIAPLSKPAFATLGTFTFLGNWNNFLWPLLVTNTVNMKTLPVGLAFFVGRYTVYWNLLMAAATFAMAPMLIVYLFAQKYFVAGITLTGMKS